MKSKRAKKVVATVIAVLALMILLFITQLVLPYNDFIRSSRIPLGGSYEKIASTFDTRRIPLALVHQFDIDGELPSEYMAYSGFYDVMPVKTLNERFGTDFENEDGNRWVAISHGRVIWGLYYDVNWQLAKYDKERGHIAIPKYERDYSPNTIYVYTSAFPLNELYTGEFHDYFTSDIRYKGDATLDAWVWTKDDPSPENNWWHWWQGFKEYVGSMGKWYTFDEEQGLIPMQR